MEAKINMGAELQHYNQQNVDNVSFMSPKVTAFPTREISQSKPLGVKTYEIAFDEERSQNLSSIVSIDEYREKKQQSMSETSFNLDTLLGERFNVALSEFTYDIKYGKIYGKDTNEPALDIFKRGRDYRLENGNPVDWAREEAEVVGFAKIEKVLADPNTKVGTMMLSISPPGLEGSTYGNNFYDVHTLKQTKNGTHYIESRRYASGLYVEEYAPILRPFFNVEVDQDDPAASLLANPIKVEGIFDADALHEYLHKDIPHLDQDIFRAVVKQCEPLKQKYLQSVIDRPWDRNLHAWNYNAYLNMADDLVSRAEEEGVEAIESDRFIPTDKMVDELIAFYGQKEVRKVMTPCGESGGYDVNGKPSKSIFSVAEFADPGVRLLLSDEDERGSLTFKCPNEKCGKINRRPRGELLEVCKYCEKSVRC